MTRARILLADDHKEMRELVVLLLDREFDIIGALPDGSAVLDATSKLKPDVCLLDISMPQLDGIEVARQLRQNGLAAKVIFLTIHEDRDFLRAALDSGARGYVVKRCLASDLPNAIREVLAGRTFVSASLCQQNGNGSR
jgi:DNA-binding NarL/FixJ family response regulator